MSLTADAAPIVVTYCHCFDCRRVTGGPVAAFAAFDEGAVHLDPDPGLAKTVTQGVRRKFCSDCGSPLTAAFDYLPGQIYVPLGIVDQADLLPPERHCHEDSRLSWLHIADHIPRTSGSGRAHLNAAVDP